jgi:hypothetical protein
MAHVLTPESPHQAAMLAARPAPEPAPELVLSDAPQVLPCLPREAYDNLKGWNASLLKLALRKTPAHAFAAYFDPDRPERESTDAFDIGNLLHALLLEPEGVNALFLREPDDLPRRPTEKQLTDGADSKPGTKARAAWEDAHARERQWLAFLASVGDRTVLKPKGYDLALAMENAVDRHPGIRPYFRPAPAQAGLFRQLNELTLTYLDPISGHRLKARIDALRVTADELRLVDLKTCADASPEGFGKAAANYDYLLSGAFYHDAVDACRLPLAELLGVDAEWLAGLPITVEFLALEKSYPFQVARYGLAPDHLELGREQYRQALDLVVNAAELDYWPGYDSGIQPLQLPAWAWGRG